MQEEEDPAYDNVGNIRRFGVYLIVLVWGWVPIVALWVLGYMPAVFDYLAMIFPFLRF